MTTQRSPQQQVKHFLKTGDSDLMPQGWSGENWLISAQNANRAMKDALIAEVQERAIGTKKFLLNIEYRERETFAYACEVYSRILELADNRKERMKLAEEVKKVFVPPDGRVDLEKFHEAISSACAARNGWKKILQVCAPAKVRHPVPQQ